MNQDLLNQIIKQAKENVQAGELMPVFFVGNDKEVNVIGAQFSSNEDKDGVALFVRKFAKQINAKFILFISESWTLPQTEAEDFMNNRHKYSSISEHPKAYEAVTFMLETPAEYKMGMAKILPGRELDEIKWASQGAVEGRFTGLLPKPELSLVH